MNAREMIESIRDGARPRDVLAEAAQGFRVSINAGQKLMLQGKSGNAWNSAEADPGPKIARFVKGGALELPLDPRELSLALSAIESLVGKLDRELSMDGQGRAQIALEKRHQKLLDKIKAAAVKAGVDVKSYELASNWTAQQADI